MHQIAKQLAKRIQDEGGHAYYVGGCVRDALLGRDVKDIDIEVFGLEQSRLEPILAEFGEVNFVGKSFGVYKIGDLDVSLPRTERKTGAGHRGFEILVDPNMMMEDAMARRDFTMNAVYQDILTGEYIDWYGGMLDIEDGIIRITDRTRFAEDSLRVLRAAQFASRLGFKVADVDFMQTIDLSDLPAERVWGEMEKLLLGQDPKRGLEVLAETGALKQLFPELSALAEVPQDPKWHSEGWVITKGASIPSVAIHTESQSLMRSYGTVASSTDEIIRVMFKIPLSRVKAVMDSAINDFEVIQNIVSPVVIFMMDVFGTQKRATKSNTHNVSMQPNASIYSSDTGFNVTSLIADFRTDSVNDNVIVTFEGFISDDYIVHNEEYNSKQGNYQVTEGDVWTHTKMVVDVASYKAMYLPKGEHITVMLACLLHDLGKATTTETIDGRVRAHGHSEAGIPLATDVLDRLGVYRLYGVDVRKNVLQLVDKHLLPAQLHNGVVASGQDTVKDSVFRRLSQKVDMNLLSYVCQADVLGRGGKVDDDCVHWFRDRIKALEFDVATGIKPILTGKHLMDAGWVQGKVLGDTLRAVFEMQLDGTVTTLEDAMREVEKLSASAK